MKAINTMIIAVIAMIGMIGSVSAVAPISEYYTEFDGSGTGTLSINTYTGAGSDYLSAGWTNTNMDGYQDTEVCGGDYTEIERGVTVGTGGTGQSSSGYIRTLSIDDAPAQNSPGDKVQVIATYKDDAAYTSHVSVWQFVELYDDGEDESVVTGTEIGGHAYGDDTLVSGMVKVDTDGIYEATIMNKVAVTEGEFYMGVLAVGNDDDCGYEDAYMDWTNSADGAGNAHVIATSDTLNVNQYVGFTGSYYNTGYIYVFEI